MSNTPDTASSAPSTKSRKKGWAIGASVLAVAVIVGGVILGVTLGSNGSNSSQAAAEPTPTSAAITDVQRVTVPDVAGMTVADARKTLEDAGLEGTPLLSSTPDTALVTQQSVTAGLEVKEGQKIILTTE